MSLYGRVDSTANQTAVGLTRGNGAGSATETIVFVDETEAGLASNKTRGITAPGWWAYRTYTDAAGNTRHKAEHLMILTNPEANADETLSDDTIAADVAVTIAIGTQPADRSSVADGASITGIFTIAATPSAGGASVVSFQWQKKSPTSTRWVNMSAGDGMTFGTGLSGGAKTGSMNASSIDKADWDGYKFRVKCTSTNGAKEVISDTATLTFA